MSALSGPVCLPRAKRPFAKRLGRYAVRLRNKEAIVRIGGLALHRACGRLTWGPAEEGATIDSGMLQHVFQRLRGVAPGYVGRAAADAFEMPSRLNRAWFHDSESYVGQLFTTASREGNLHRRGPGSDHARVRVARQRASAGAARAYPPCAQ